MQTQKLSEKKERKGKNKIEAEKGEIRIVDEHTRIFKLHHLPTIASIFRI